MAADVDEAAVWLTERVMTCVRNHIPRTTFRPKTECQWVSSHSKGLSLEKDAAYRDWRRGLTPSKESAWKNFKKRLRKTVQQYKRQYFAELFRTGQSPRDFWKSVRMISGKNTKPEIPDLEREDRRRANSNKDKAELLVEQFHSVFTRAGTAKTIDEGQGEEE